MKKSNLYLASCMCILTACLSIGFLMQNPSTVHAGSWNLSTDEPAQNPNKDSAQADHPDTVPMDPDKPYANDYSDHLPVQISDDGDELPIQIPDDDEDELPVQIPDDGDELPVQDDEYTDDQGITYTLHKNNNTSYISGWTSTMKNSITIPAEITQNGIIYQVKGISSTAFKQCSTLHKIKIPNSLTDIAGNTFSSCKNLSNIQILPVIYTTTTSAKTSVVRAALNSALLSASANVTMEIDHTVLDKAISNKKSDKISFILSITDHGNYNSTGRIPDKILLQPQTAKTIAEHNKSFQVKIKDGSGKICCTAAASGLEQVSSALNFSLIKNQYKIPPAH